MEQKTQQSELRMTPEVAAAAIADRCRKDGEFLKNLNSDPLAALTKAGGEGVPDSMNVIIHQNSADHWHIVIPSDAQAKRLSEVFKTIDNAGDTLSDDQLQDVSGGTDVLATAALALAVGASLATSVAGGSTIGSLASTTALVGIAAAQAGSSS